MTPARWAGALACLLVLAACAAPVGRPSPVAAPAPAAPTSAAPPAPPIDAVAAGLRPGPAVATLASDPAQAAAALAAFRRSCPALLSRLDASGLTRGEDWRPACEAAAGWPAETAAGFFRAQFEAVQVGDGALFATGYYEPEIAASRRPAAGYAVPIYAMPDDLVEADLGAFAPDLAGRRVRGRIAGGRLIPYHDRAAIETQGLGGHAAVIAYAADAIDLFFLQIQGSGRLRLPDGGVLRIGYAGQNGLPYTGIGKRMLADGLLAPGEATMQGIVGWLRAHPDRAAATMRQNRSYVFFRPLDGPPTGTLGVPVTARVTVAADPRFVPLGAPVWLAPDRGEAAGLWVAQDTGGAIRGANRVDTFWGAGAAAARIAGGMAARGGMTLLLPRGTLARIAQDGGRPARP